MEEWLMVGLLVLAVAVMFNYVLTFALIRRQANTPVPQSSPQPADFLTPGQKLPSFAAETIHGERVTDEHYAGRSVVFLFFKSQCAPCQEALPTYERASARAAQVGVDLVLVSLDGQADARSFAEQHHVRLPIIVAPQASNPLKNDLRIPGTPSFCMVDAAGIVRQSGISSNDSTNWRALIDSWNTMSQQPSLVLSERG